MKNREVAELLMKNPEAICGVAVNDRLPLIIHAIMTVVQVKELDNMTVIVGKED